MPEELEKKLRAAAEKKFPGDSERQDRYVYGALRDHGWTPPKIPSKHVRLPEKPKTQVQIQKDYQLAERARKRARDRLRFKKVK